MSRLVKRLSVAFILAIIGLAVAACGSSSKLSPPARIVCVDSTISTNSVRRDYLPGLMQVANEAAAAHTTFAAADCGANATGTVDWPVQHDFKSSSLFSGDLARQYEIRQVAKLEPQLASLVDATATVPGTPLGEMLAVAARECTALGGGCDVVVLTDGGWADQLLRVRNGVAQRELERYVAANRSELSGLKGSSVRFAGVGLGTDLGENRLAESERVAKALIQGAGGRLVSWNVTLPGS